MRKQLFNALLFCLMVVPFMGAKADTAVEGQSTEGTDFWVTFLQADHRDGDNKSIQLSLTVSSRENCEVTIANPYFVGKQIDAYIDGVLSQTTLPFQVSIVANQATEIQLYSGTAQSTNTENEFCYTRRNETVDQTAVHVTSTQPISLYASNYKEASFDAANVLPVAALQNEYLIQCYTPSDHGNKPQGSHFAIVAVEDSTVVTYTLSESTNYSVKGQPVKTDTLKAGQVWYVWTGDGEDHDYDLSGSFVSSNKPIAVFQGNPHTNLPFYKDQGLSNPVQQRDHLFSQAMPTSTWGNTFAITRSARKRDVLRIMALNDSTEVRINGVLRHTFDFSTERKQYWEIQLGDAITNGGKEGNETRPDAEVPGGSCFIETSCPAGIHLFIVSQEWDGKRNNNDGDPSMLWVNPIEQRIDQITFSTYSSKNSKGSGTKHFVNVVTDSVNVLTNNRMKLDGAPLTGWEPVVGSDNNGDGQYRYYYVRHALGTTAKGSKPLSHTLLLDGATAGEGFTAYVYGYTSNESYGYNAGGATKPLTQSITINGEVFSPDKENKLCGIDTVHFACKPDYEIEQVVWHFGDGTPDVTITDTAVIVPHYYQNGGDYDATCSIYRSSSNLCKGQSAVIVIKIKVTIGRYSFSIGKANIPCPENGVQQPGRIPYTSSIDLKGDNVTVDFDAAAKAAGFKQSDISIKDGYFELNIPSTAEASVPYGIKIKITSTCGDKDTTMLFQLPIGNDVITQRYNNVLGLLNDSRFDGQTLSDFQWYRKSDSTAIEGQVSSNLNMYDLPEATYRNDEFYICYTINKGQADERYTCACAKGFGDPEKEHEFEANPESLIITAGYDIQEDKVFVNANWGGKKDIECYAQWINASGNVYQDLKFSIPDGGCTIPTPNENGLYLLRVVTDGKSRSFKFIINK